MSPDRKPNWKIALEISGHVIHRTIKVTSILALLTLTFGPPLPTAPINSLPKRVSEDDFVR